MKNIQERIKAILVDEMEIDIDLAVEKANLTNNRQDTYECLSVFEDIAMDSLMLVDFISNLEIEFDIKIQLKDFDNIKTFKDIAIMISHRLSE